MKPHDNVTNKKKKNKKQHAQILTSGCYTRKEKLSVSQRKMLSTIAMHTHQSLCRCKSSACVKDCVVLAAC